MHGLIDSHCHLDFSDFDADRPALLDGIQTAGICGLIVPAVTLKTFPRLKLLCQNHPQMIPAYGLHPLFMSDHQIEHLSELEKWLEAERPCAVGEIGLDHFQANSERTEQQDLFVGQLELAQQHHLPVILHVRKAHDKILQRLKAQRFDRGGIVHAFNGSFEQAKLYLDLGFKLGFGGTLTYSGSRKIRDNFSKLPLDAPVLETDSPDMATASNRGGRNNPLFLSEILTAAKQLRKESESELREAFYTNTMSSLNLCVDQNGMIKVKHP